MRTIRYEVGFDQTGEMATGTISVACDPDESEVAFRNRAFTVLAMQWGGAADVIHVIEW